MVHYHRTIKMSPNEAEKLCIPQLSLEKGDSVMDVLKEAASIKLNIQKIKKETEKAAHQANKTYLKGKIVVQYQVNMVVFVRISRRYKKKNEPEFSRKGCIVEIGTGYLEYYAKIRWDHTGGAGDDEPPQSVSRKWYHFYDLRPYEFGHDNDLRNHMDPGEPEDLTKEEKLEIEIENTEEPDEEVEEVTLSEGDGELSLVQTRPEPAQPVMVQPAVYVANVVSEPAQDTTTTTAGPTPSTTRGTYKPPTLWSLQEVCSWLESVNLNVFQENVIVGEVLTELMEEDIKELIPAIGLRKMFLKYWRQLMQTLASQNIRDLEQLSHIPENSAIYHNNSTIICDSITTLNQNVPTLPSTAEDISLASSRSIADVTAQYDAQATLCKETNLASSNKTTPVRSRASKKGTIKRKAAKGVHELENAPKRRK
jgi:hypothetical protein